MPFESFKERLVAGQVQVGIRCQLCSPIAVEALGFFGFDYVYIDMEHAPNDLMSVLHQCHAAAATSAHSVVRLPHNDGVLIQRLLDAGINNIVVPMVENAEDAARAVAATRYPPAGIRGAAGSHRGNRYGADTDYVARIAERICLIVQVESRQGLKNLAQIAAVEGVDGVLFGPADIAADFGHLGTPTHPEVGEAVIRGIGTVREAGKFPGMSATGVDGGKRWFAEGCQFVSVGGDIPILTQNARKLAQGFSDLPGRTTA